VQHDVVEAFAAGGTAVPAILAQGIAEPAYDSVEDEAP
jgi:hypothetical protein